MPIGFEEFTSKPSTSSSGNGGNQAGEFECNICFDLAQDPVVTLCGHLFCWPCLYRWLHHHSKSQECPVCKALIQKEKLVPLYGRGKTTTDPRSRPVPGMDIPNRPPGQRPDTASPPPDRNYFSNFGIGSLGGFIPMATTTFGNMTMSAGFGGLFPGFFNFQFHHGFPDASMYGTTHGFPYGHGYAQTSARSNGHGMQGPRQQLAQSQDSFLSFLITVIILFVFLTLFWG